jgi:[acyl-carrier-protein] S-malonyltransferase
LATSIIFPAFVHEYHGSEEIALSAFGNHFPVLVETAADTLGINLNQFDFQNNNFLNDEEKSQFISYIFSCSIADILKSRHLKPAFISGYSMGIYAALYYCGTIDFRTGLMLIKQAWDCISEVTKGSEYGMGMIIGLTENDIQELFRDDSGIEICNQNNPYTFIISGNKKSVTRVLDSAKAEGAMRTTLLSVSQPYHSGFLLKAEPAFAKKIKDYTFRPSEYNYISSIDQRVLTSGDELRNEVIRNLSHKMNWNKTMNFLSAQGSDFFFECGAGDGLTRNSRFIEGNYHAFSVSRIEQFISESQQYL